MKKNQILIGTSYRKDKGKRMFETPEELIDMFEEYCEWCEDNPLNTTEYRTVDKILEKVIIPKARVMSLKSFALFCGTYEAYFYEFKSQMMKRWEKDEDKKVWISAFNNAFRIIDDCIYSQKFEGAAAGLFKEGLIKADLGIVDRSETKNVNFNSVEMTKEEINEINNKLEEEY